MPPEVFQFEDVTVDLRRMSVWRAGQPVSLEPKTFDVLRYLIEHRDRLVTKEELLDTVWKDTFVTPNVLTRAVAQLRKALGDDAFEARYVETVAKRGYRFIAPVTRYPAAADVTAIPPPTPASQLTFHRAASPRSASGHSPSLRFAAVALGLFAMRDRASATPARSGGSQVSPRRFTTGSQSYSFPAISPDGRTIAYSSDRDGAMEIYTSGFTPGTARVALTNDGGQNIFADWSPDGQMVAYHSRKKGGIWMVPSGGGAARQVVNFGSQPSWTPDGEQMVFTSDAGGMAAQSILWIVHRDGSGRRQLTKLGAPRGGHSRPSVSPMVASSHSACRTATSALKCGPCRSPVPPAQNSATGHRRISRVTARRCSGWAGRSRATTRSCAWPSTSAASLPHRRRHSRFFPEASSGTSRWRATARRFSGCSRGGEPVGRRRAGSRHRAARSDHGRRRAEHAAAAFSRRPHRIQSIRVGPAADGLGDERGRQQS